MIFLSPSLTLLFGKYIISYNIKGLSPNKKCPVSQNIPNFNQWNVGVSMYSFSSYVQHVTTFDNGWDRVHLLKTKSQTTGNEDNYGNGMIRRNSQNYLDLSWFIVHMLHRIVSLRSLKRKSNDGGCISRNILLYWLYLVINSLQSNDTIWRMRTMLSFVQALTWLVGCTKPLSELMQTCCQPDLLEHILVKFESNPKKLQLLTHWGHYQYWNNGILMNKLQWNFDWNSNIFVDENTFKNVVCEIFSISSRPQLLFFPGLSALMKARLFIAVVCVLCIGIEYNCI